MPTARVRNQLPDVRPMTGGQRRREAGWRADAGHLAAANAERERSRRKLKRERRPQAAPKPRRLPSPVDLLASAMAAGVSQRQVAADLDISHFALHRVLNQEKVRLAYEQGEENRRQLRSMLRHVAATQPPKHKLLAAAADPLARALAVGVAPAQAAADLGVAPSTITRALERAKSPTAAGYLTAIRRGYDDGQERQRQCRRLLQQRNAGG